MTAHTQASTAPNLPLVSLAKDNSGNSHQLGRIFDMFTLNPKMIPVKNSTHFLKSSLLALLLAFSCTFAMAQDEDGENEATPVEQDGPKHISGGFGYFTPGFGMQDLGALNSFTGATGLNGNGITLGGGGLVMIKSLMLGGEGSSFLDRDASVGNLNVQLLSGWGKASIGYVVYGRRGLLIYPKVGFGGSTQTLTLDKTNAVANVDSIFAGGYSSTTLQKKGLFMSFGAGFDWMPGFDETAGSGLVIGFDLGYNLAVSEGNWYALNTKLAGGPSVTPNGVFVNLHIGFAGWNRQ
jgi:hypothetical protein